MFFSHKGWLKNNHLTNICIYIYIFTFCLFPAPPVLLLMLDPPYKTDLIETKRILDENPQETHQSAFRRCLAQESL